MVRWDFCGPPFIMYHFYSTHYVFLEEWEYMVIDREIKNLLQKITYNFNTSF